MRDVEIIFGPFSEAWNCSVSSSYGIGGFKSAPPPNHAFPVVRKRVFICTAGTCGLAIWATRLIPVAVKPGFSALAPLIVPANSGAKFPRTVDTFTPTFSKTLPFIKPRVPPPGSELPSSSRLQLSYRKLASDPASRSIASNSAHMRSRRFSNHLRAASVCCVQSVMPKALPSHFGYGNSALWFPFRSPVRNGS